MVLIVSTHIRDSKGLRSKGLYKISNLKLERGLNIIHFLLLIKNISIFIFSPFLFFLKQIKIELLWSYKNKCIKYKTPSNFKLEMNTTTQTQSAAGQSAVTFESVFQTPEKLSFTLANGLSVKIGKNTDIGGSKINQDAHCVIHFKNSDNVSGCAICVADGHGEKGEIASECGLKFLKEIIRRGADELYSEPVSFLNKAFIHIHDKIRDSLVDALKDEKYEVEVNKLTGEILKRRMPTHAFTSLKSGTTFSVIVLLGKTLYIANVGDSTGLLFSGTPILKPSHLTDELNSSVVTTSTAESCLDDYRTYIELTGDHSPENPEEYIRMRKFKCSEENPLSAELLCVYNEDKPKHLCPRVFDISEEGVPTVRTDFETFGFSYKNVRKDKATYVTDKYGSNALSVTRALGDYALNHMGVSCEPEIRSINLEPLFNQMKENMALNATATATASGGSELETETALKTSKTLCVVLCSDGVWDNWIYDHVGKFVFDKSCLDALAQDTVRGAERITNSFMLRNQTFAKKNFGWNSDNATGIVMYISDV